MDYEYFKRLALAPLSCDSLILAEAAFKVLKRRYPNFMSSVATYPSTEDDFIPETPIGRVPESWESYVQRDLSAVPFSPREALVRGLASGHSINETVVKEYLKLLRERPSIGILEIRHVEEETCNLQDVKGDRPTIVPLRNGDAWAFAVVYSDCIHYYDSRATGSLLNLSAKDPRVIGNCWTGPKQDDEQDSGIFMLLGIRRILQGDPHLSQRATEGIMVSYRARIAIELMCEKLDPSEEDFKSIKLFDESLDAILEDEEERETSFGLTPSTVMEITSSEGIEWEGEVEFQVASHSSVASSKPRSLESTGQSSSETQRANDTPMTSPQPTSFPSVRRNSPRSHLSRGGPGNPVSSSYTISFNNGKKNLDLLSAAILFYRYAGTSRQKSLPVLWQLMKNRDLGSRFHERYNAVLFHNKMNDLDDNAVSSAMSSEISLKMNYPVNVKRMRTVQKQCQFWNDVCSCSVAWVDDGMSEYEDKFALLLALPDLSDKCIKQQGSDILSQLNNRLADASDPLTIWLSHARHLCAAIVKQSLSEEILMMDLYHIKQVKDTDLETYKAFVSINPRVTMRLPPAESSPFR